MSESISKVLSDLIAKEGLRLLRDIDKCETILANVLPNQRKERFLLIAALENRVVADLLDVSQGVELEMVILEAAAKLHENYAIVDDSAIWVVSTWADALGLCQPEVEKEVNAVVEESIAIPESNTDEGVSNQSEEVCEPLIISVDDSYQIIGLSAKSDGFTVALVSHDELEDEEEDENEDEAEDEDEEEDEEEDEDVDEEVDEEVVRNYLRSYAMRIVTRTKVIIRMSEYVVLAFDQFGQRYPEADYHSNDRDDALRKAMTIKGDEG